MRASTAPRIPNWVTRTPPIIHDGKSSSAPVSPALTLMSSSTDGNTSAAMTSPRARNGGTSKEPATSPSPRRSLAEASSSSPAPTAVGALFTQSFPTPKTTWRRTDRPSSGPRKVPETTCRLPRRGRSRPFLLRQRSPHRLPTLFGRTGFPTTPRYRLQLHPFPRRRR